MSLYIWTKAALSSSPLWALSCLLKSMPASNSIEALRLLASFVPEAVAAGLGSLLLLLLLLLSDLLPLRSLLLLRLLEESDLD
eukprot:CAMPEP_0182475074 /NCGR_PEP_ID=MMETSP1319-20130603/26757_1 /TAXON_ID=172717 /ORGANISM="Bolidomonas pacifica, Strain RCC208" /LENGTH=82 /DNA_ID=CAMNT_0024676025 /DNA_START=56 /DNA_END=301 /DNA_ORIENTATION=-